MDEDAEKDVHMEPVVVTTTICEGPPGDRNSSDFDIPTPSLFLTTMLAPIFTVKKWRNGAVR